MRTHQESPSSQHEGTRDRRGISASNEAVSGDSDRQGLRLAFTDALADILRWEAKQASRAKH